MPRLVIALGLLSGTISFFVPACNCTAAQFTDVTVSAGLSYNQWQTPIPDEEPTLYMTGGAAAADYDNDGWVDLFVTRLDDTDILYRNLGNGTFQDVSLSAGFNQSLRTNGATWGDIDNDGDKDLYLTALVHTPPRNHLYINNGNGTFTEEAVSRGADLTAQQHTNSFSSTFGDYDGDGYLDLFTTEWHSEIGFGNTRLLHNLGATNPGHYEDVTLSAGVDVSVGHPFQRSHAFAPSFADMDRDGLTDLVIAGDFGNSRLFWNNGDGTFTNGTAAAGVGSDENGMGSAIGDYDGDGDLDWFVSSIYEEGGSCGGLPFCGWGDSGNRLFRNNGNRTFTDVTDSANVREGGWGWGATFVDYDNDGDLDLTHTNGVDFPLETRDAPFTDDQTRFWENNDGTFSDVATQIGVTDIDSGKGLLRFDYDNDGDQDLFIVNNSGEPILYRNDGGNSNHWLQIKVVGTQSNADGIGAQITVIPDGSTPENFLYREVSAGSNFLGQNDVIAHFGLGELSGSIDQVRIEWPASGIVQNLENVTADSNLTVTESILADYNQDGLVNIADYTKWLAIYGSNIVLPNENPMAITPGVVDLEDYEFWKSQFAMGSSLALLNSAASSLPTPEPSSLVLFLTCWVALLVRQRGR